VRGVEAVGARAALGEGETSEHEEGVDLAVEVEQSRDAA
jgi:hypothetical protein